MPGVATATPTIASTPAPRRRTGRRAAACPTATPGWRRRRAAARSASGAAGAELTPLRGVRGRPSRGRAGRAGSARGLLMPAARDRLAPGRDRVVGGPAGVAVVGRLGEVVREVLACASPRGLERLAHPARAVARAGPRRDPRRAPPHERVLEPVVAVAALGDQPCGAGLVEGVEEFVARVRRPRSPRPRTPARITAAVRRTACAGGLKPSLAGEDHIAQRVRRRELARLVHVGDQLADEERVAVGLGHEPRGERGVRRVEQGGDRRLVQARRDPVRRVRARLRPRGRARRRGRARGSASADVPERIR